MKTTRTLILLAALSAATSVPAQTNSPDGAVSAPAVVTNAPIAVPVPASTPVVEQQIPQPLPESTNAPVAAADTNVHSGPAFAPVSGTNSLHLDFRGAPLEQVLNYLSEAAGFIVVLEAQPRGTVDVFSSSPVTREEAVNLLDQALKKNGFAAIRRGRTLTIVSHDEAKIGAIPVFVGGDPSTIPMTDQIVTQIIPVRFVEVAQLVKDLQPLVSTQTTMTANESGNEIVITDTQANIHKVAEVIKAIDAGAEDVTVVRVFRLNYADPSEMADLLGSLFPDDSKSGGASSPVQLGAPGGLRSFFRGGGFGGGGFGGGAPGGAAAAAGGNQNSRIKKRARVIAVADPRTSSLVVTCSKDLMDQIDGVISELDANPAKKKRVQVFKLNNADPSDLQSVLQDIFQKNGAQTSRGNSGQSALQQRSQSQQTSSSTSSSSSSGSRGGGSGSSSFGR